MPTGYTHKVNDGTVTDLKTFAMICARGMGACVTMRDDPNDAIISERFEPSDYHQKKILEVTAEIARLKMMTAAERDIEAGAQYAEAVAAWERRHAKDVEIRARYESMIRQTEAWTCKAEGLKNFMLQQLRDSMKFDCGMEYDVKPKRVDSETWHAKALEEAERSLKYHTEELAAEVARVEGRNRWLRDMRESF